MAPRVRFVLASGSPARLATLRAAGVEPEVIVSEVDETAITAPTPSDLVESLAIAKAMAVSQRIDGHALVLGCDSMLDLDGVAYGKPASADEAVERWRAMRGTTGVLRTGHALIDAENDRALSVVASTAVTFGEVSNAEIEAYVSTGEALSVAGGFTIDGLGGWFVDAVSGDHHNVVGLSLPALRTMLGQLGYGLVDIGYPG